MRTLLLSLLAVCCFAAGPVGTLTSSASFRLDDTNVAVAGVPHWPVSSGQTIATGDAPAMLELSGSKLWLLPKTKLSLGHSGAHVLVKVSEGGLAYKLSQGAVVELSSASGKQVPRESREGRLQVGPSEAWAPSEAVFYESKAAAPRGVNTNQTYRPSPFETEFMNGWRQYNPPFGNPPGQGNAPPFGGTPPGLGHNPNGLPPASVFIKP